MELNHHGRRVEKAKEKHADVISRKQGLERAKKDRSKLRLEKELKKRNKNNQ